MWATERLAVLSNMAQPGQNTRGHTRFCQELFAEGRNILKKLLGLKIDLFLLFPIILSEVVSLEHFFCQLFMSRDKIC